MNEIQLLAKIKNEIKNHFTFNTANKSLIEIIDDTAIISNSVAMQILTSDMLIEDIHFSKQTASFEDIGWKAIARNLSDVAAMGAIPSYFLISLGITKKMNINQVIQIYKGMRILAKKYKVNLVGGDSSISSKLFISITMNGILKALPLLRTKARINDLICITGNLGGSAAGLLTLKKDYSVKNSLTKIHLRPNPRIIEANKLAKIGVHSAIDISDGLLIDLQKLVIASNVSAEIDLNSIPINNLVKKLFPKISLDLALTGGEDYELIFTCPPNLINTVDKILASKFSIIGKIRQKNKTPIRILQNGVDAKNIKIQGWDPFK